MNGNRQLGWGNTAAKPKLVIPQIEARSNESILPEATAIHAELLCKFKITNGKQITWWGSADALPQLLASSIQANLNKIKPLEKTAIHAEHTY